MWSAPYRRSKEITMIERRLASVATVAVFFLSACTGGGTTPSAVASAAAPSAVASAAAPSAAENAA